MIKIYRATKTNQINQGFGRAKTNSSVLYIYESMGLLGHDGIDWGVVCVNFTVKTGGQCEPIFCDLADGAKITYIQKDVTNGFGIIAIDKDGDKHIWWHFDSISPSLKVGDRIESGDFLGISGTTGKSTGPHLHRGYYRYDEDPNNGYQGATDQTNYMVNIFIKDVIANLGSQISLLQKIILLIKQKLQIK